MQWGTHYSYLPRSDVYIYALSFSMLQFGLRYIISVKHHAMGPQRHGSQGWKNMNKWTEIPLLTFHNSTSYVML